MRNIKDQLSESVSKLETIKSELEDQIGIIGSELVSKCKEMFDEVFGDSESNSLQVAYGQNAYDAYKCEVRNAIENAFGVDLTDKYPASNIGDDLTWLSHDASDEVDEVIDGLEDVASDIDNIKGTLEDLIELSELSEKAVLVDSVKEEFKRKIYEVYGVEV